MEPLVYTMVVLLIFPTLMFFYMRARTTGKILCWMLEEDRTAKQYLRKVQGDFVRFPDSSYLVNSDSVRFVRYPASWPSFLQQTIPCSLYRRGDTQPLDWTTAASIALSASELSSVMEPEWMKLIVKGTKDSSAQGRLSNLMPALSLGATGLVAILVFYLISRIGELQAAVTRIQSLGGG